MTAAGFASTGFHLKFPYAAYEGMPIPELELARARRALDRFCDSIPPAIRFQLAYVYTIERNAVVLVERRAHFQDPPGTPSTHSRRSSTTPGWGTGSLRWRDRDSTHIFFG